MCEVTFHHAIVSRVAQDIVNVQNSTMRYIDTIPVWGEHEPNTLVQESLRFPL
jgi:hypothetical protein